MSETLIKSVRGEYFPFTPLDTPRLARHSERTGNVSNHCFGLNQRFQRALLAFVLALSSHSVLAADFTVLRPQESKVTFVSRQMGVPVEGSFKKFNAVIAIDPAKPENGKAQIDINLASIDVGSTEAYDEVIGSSWFDTAKYPSASFISGKVTRTAPGRFEATGKMTIRNVSRDVKAPFTLEQKADTIIIDGMFPLKRLDYGIGSGMWSDTDTVADEVQIRFRFTVANKK
jgi:polyisoprenoid-binding protein YceI